MMHSHAYTEEPQLAGRKVVVVGMGNSAMDIAVDASYHARATYLSARRGVHVIPKYVWGRPYDQLAGSEWIPGFVAFRSRATTAICASCDGSAAAAPAALRAAPWSTGLSPASRPAWPPSRSRR